MKDFIILQSQLILYIICRTSTNQKMAQSKLNDFAGKFGKGGPPGLTTGIKVLAALGATAYGISQSLYTGDDFYLMIHFTLFLLLGEGWGMCKLLFYPIASATIF